MNKTDEGKRLLNNLQSAKEVYTIRKHNKNITKVSNNSDPNVKASWKNGDMGWIGKKTENYGIFGWLALAHELAHSEQVNDGTISENKISTPDGDNVIYPSKFDYSSGKATEYSTLNECPLLLDEVLAMDIENKIRIQSGFKVRKFYGRLQVNNPVLKIAHSIGYHQVVNNNGTSIYTNKPFEKNQLEIVIPSLDTTKSIEEIEN